MPENQGGKKGGNNFLRKAMKERGIKNYPYYCGAVIDYARHKRIYGKKARPPKRDTMQLYKG